MKIDRGHIILGVVLLCCLVALTVSLGLFKTKVKQNKDLQAQAALDAIKFEELEEGLARADSELVTQKELNQTLKNTMAEQYGTIMADLAELKAKPSIVHNTTSVVEGDTNVIYDTDFPSDFKFLTRDGMSVAQYQYEDREFTAQTFDLTVQSGVVISEDKFGNKIAHVRGTISSSDPEDSGEYPLDIINSELAFVKPDKIEVFWAPHVDAGLSAGYNITEQKGAIHGSIGFTPFAVGQTQADNIIRFPRVSGHFNSSGAGIGIQPVIINIARPLPLVDDIWLGIGPTFASDGNSIQATVSSTF